MSDSSLPPRFAGFIANTMRHGGRGETARYPGLPAQPWHDPQAFPLVRALESQAAAIIAELRAVAESEFVPEREAIGRRGRWDVAFLGERGRANPQLAARCPVTMTALATLRTIRTQSGLAYLSRLSAASHVAPHRGPTNVRLRCHLGVDIPDDCGLRVGDETRTWTEGRCVVFDDSFEHEAWNRDVRDRLVLVADVWHADLSDEEVALLEGFDAYVDSRARNLAIYHARNAPRPTAPAALQR